MADEKRKEVRRPKDAPPSGGRVAVAVLICLLVIAYTAAVVSGWVPTEHKIDAVNLALIALALVGVGLLLRLRRSSG